MKNMFENPVAKKSLEVLGNKKVQWTIVGVIILITLIWSSSIRVSNLPLLVDQTTGKHIPTALDPFYFLRMAEVMEKGGLPQYDPLRGPFNVGWTSEILSDSIVIIHKISNIFGNYSLQYIDVISPVIFYILGLVVFFFLVFLLTRSKLAATVSSIFLAFIPSYLYRSMAGFADHEAIGMLAFFLTLIPLIILLKNFEVQKNDKKFVKNCLLLSIILGFLTTLTVVSWGGIASFLFMIIPLSFLLFWIINEKKYAIKQKKWLTISYFCWGIIGVLSGILFRTGAGGIFAWFTSGFGGILFLFVLGFLVVDLLLISYLKETNPLKKYRIVASFVLTVVLGILISPLIGLNFFSLISDFLSRLIHPFGTGRVGLTVAENKQPFLEDWTSQIGPRFFWIFLLGSLFLGAEISKMVKQKKEKFWFISLWIFMILGITLSRLSATSMLNGTNFISKLFYIGSIVIFLIYSLYLYFNKKLENLSGRLIVFIALLLPMLVGTRGAIRLFFVITPVTCMMVGYGFDQLIKKLKTSKEDATKLFFGAGTILVIVLLILSFNFFSQTISAQAKYTGPSANYQWQKAMEWTRNNTSTDSIFVHWWDYGYWVEYLGERKTIADGGHFEGEFRDHLIGRYVLTNPNPNSALSFMKSNGINYLLIDPTDIGKYPAYSIIGSDESTEDRYSWIQAMISDPSQTQETRNGTLRVYTGGVPLDEDLIYNNNGTPVFLPKGKAGLGAVIFETIGSGETVSFGQPTAIYVYNGQQYRIPIRYLEYEGDFSDFGLGVESTVKIFPYIGVSGQNLQIDPIGAMMYLSPRVTSSLFAQLYLMNDPNNLYLTLNLSHSEPDPVVTSLKSQGANVNEFVYYQGIRGPIKIWGVNYPDDIISREEFLRTEGRYAEFDNLTFTK